MMVRLTFIEDLLYFRQSAKLFMGMISFDPHINSMSRYYTLVHFTIRETETHNLIALLHKLLVIVEIEQVNSKGLPSPGT